MEPLLKIILATIGLTAWSYVLVMRCIKLINSHIDKELHQKQ